MWALFLGIGLTLWLALDNLFYLLNFGYIGTSIALGLFLYARKYKHARRVVEFLVGTYMLVGLGFIGHENMQIEGFWYYLFLGVFEGATIHYLVAKIAGPFLFGRGWCGYACWTAMILDLLPYKVPRDPRKRLGWIRYVVFIVAFLFVGALFVFHVSNADHVIFVAFIVGNAIYYVLGIILAFAFKDNRAFCKYICPVAVIMKPASYFSLSRIKVDPDKCVDCGLCLKVCPMNVEMTNPSRKRINGTECILCLTCVDTCPKKALH